MIGFVSLYPSNAFSTSLFRFADLRAIPLVYSPDEKKTTCALRQQMVGVWRTCYESAAREINSRLVGSYQHINPGYESVLNAHRDHPNTITLNILVPVQTNSGHYVRSLNAL